MLCLTAQLHKPGRQRPAGQGLKNHLGCNVPVSVFYDAEERIASAAELGENAGELLNSLLGKSPVSSPPDDESPQIMFSLARRRLLKLEPDDTKRLFRQHRPTADLALLLRCQPPLQVAE
jgi:hypothetical protein